MYGDKTKGVECLIETDRYRQVYQTMGNMYYRTIINSSAAESGQVRWIIDRRMVEALSDVIGHQPRLHSVFTRPKNCHECIFPWGYES